jgi:hypothetical protein
LNGQTLFVIYKYNQWTKNKSKDRNITA